MQQEGRRSDGPTETRWARQEPQGCDGNAARAPQRRRRNPGKRVIGDLEIACGGATPEISRFTGTLTTLLFLECEAQPPKAQMIAR
jgi:hypothetical protein